MKYDPTKIRRDLKSARDEKCEDELLKIVSNENQDVRFSLNKKQRWEMVEILREQEKINQTTSVYTDTVKRSKSAQFRAKFKGMKRDDSPPTRKDIIIEQNTYLMSTNKEKYR